MDLRLEWSVICSDMCCAAPVNEAGFRQQVGLEAAAPALSMHVHWSRPLHPCTARHALLHV